MMHSKATIVFDLDDTICFPNHDARNSEDKYGKAAPNLPIIEKMRVLQCVGHRIVIMSARRMLTHEGDVQAIVDDVGKITIDFLKRHKVPCDELMFGKPYGMYYVDDKAMTLDMFLNKDLETF